MARHSCWWMFMWNQFRVSKLPMLIVKISMLVSWCNLKIIFRLESLNKNPGSKVIKLKSGISTHSEIALWPHFYLHRNKKHTIANWEISQHIKRNNYGKLEVTSVLQGTKSLFSLHWGIKRLIASGVFICLTHWFSFLNYPKYYS